MDQVGMNIPSRFVSFGIREERDPLVPGEEQLKRPLHATRAVEFVVVAA